MSNVRKVEHKLCVVDVNNGFVSNIFNEHRQELGHEMDHLTQQHDVLHQDLISTNDDQHPSIHPY